MYLLLNLASLHANVSGHLIPSQTESNKWCQVYLGSLSADVSKGDIREALHCFGATSVNYY